jgi:hypothetical protein
MRNALICTALMLGTVASGHADARQMPPSKTVDQMNAEAGNDAHQAIAKVYDPIKAKTDFYAKHVLNGVTTWDVDVKNANGQSMAVVTTAGEYLVQGRPIPPSEVPTAVQTTVQDLFKTPPPNLGLVKTFQYLVGIKSGKDSYEVRTDATGRILKITPYSDRRFANPAKWPEAQANDKQVINGYVTKAWAGVTPQDVRVLDPAHGLYLATFTQNGGTGYAEINGGGFIALIQQPIDASKLPPAAAKSIGQFFKSDQTLSVHEIREQLYEAEEIANGAMLSTHIKVTGLVEDVRTTAVNE